MIEYLTNIDKENMLENINGIGTFITSLATLYALIILIKQRKDSFRPKIIFGDTLYGKCISEKNQILKSRWIDEYKDDNENNYFCFELFNAGVGIAENVIVKERFDYKKAIRFIKDLDLDNEFEISLNKSDVTIRTTFDDTFVILFVDMEARELGTFLPIGHNEKSKYIFNDLFTSFLSCFDYLRSKRIDDISLDKFPSCKVELWYSDLEGKQYKSKYECKVSSLLRDSYSFVYMKK